MRQALLLLADSRLPAGGHAHSGGVAPAVDAGLLATGADPGRVAEFLRGRLHTVGLLTGAIAARAAYLARSDADRACWPELDAAVDARTPSAAQRATSRTQGRALLRVTARSFPHPAHALLGRTPHHPIVLGVTTAAAAGTPAEAAELAVAAALSGPASAAVRLLGLDPLALTAAHAALTAEADAVAASAAGYADRPTEELPAASAPMLDLLAEAHVLSAVRLFAS
jgi:urease accessory protein